MFTKPTYIDKEEREENSNYKAPAFENANL